MGLGIFKSIRNRFSKFRRKLIEQAYFDYLFDDFKKMQESLQTNPQISPQKICIDASNLIEKINQANPIKSTDLWNDFRKTEICPDCAILKEIKAYKGILICEKRTAKEILTKFMDINYCISCGKKIE
jgi:hypothetical protein